MKIYGRLTAPALLLFLVGGIFAESSSTFSAVSTRQRHSKALARRGLYEDLLEGGRRLYNELHQDFNNLVVGSSSSHGRLRQEMEDSPVSQPFSIPRVEFSGYSGEYRGATLPTRFGPTSSYEEGLVRLQSLENQATQIEQAMKGFDENDVRGLGSFENEKKFVEFYVKRLELEDDITELSTVMIEDLQEQGRKIQTSIDNYNKLNLEAPENSERRAGYLDLLGRKDGILRKIETISNRLASRKRV